MYLSFSYCWHSVVFHVATRQRLRAARFLGLVGRVSLPRAWLAFLRAVVSSLHGWSGFRNSSTALKVRMASAVSRRIRSSAIGSGLHHGSSG